MRIKSLPPLPESVQKIQEICNNPESGIADLVRVVEKDPMLTANLLKAANSPLYGFSREIKTVSQAISLFGMATVKGFALASAVRNTLTIDLSPYGIDTKQFANVAQLQSALMINWYPKVNRHMMNILAPASFLDGLGQIIMSAELIKQNKGSEFQSKINESETVEEPEVDTFEITSPIVSASVFDHWRFEQLMIDAIKYSDHPETADEEVRPYAIALKVVRTAVNVKDQLTPASVDNAVALIEELGLDKADFLAAVETVQGA
jgi:HD-like signal output (HDOD) protein